MLYPCDVSLGVNEVCNFPSVINRKPQEESTLHWSHTLVPWARFVAILTIYLLKVQLSHYVDQVVLKPTEILLPLPMSMLECWD